MPSKSYYPSEYTLTHMGSFGTFKRYGSKPPKKSSTSESKIPLFAKGQTRAFDKENLLQQVRQERKKTGIMRSTNLMLMRTVSGSRLKISTNDKKAYIRPQSSNKLINLRRQVDQLLVLLQTQKKQMNEIKTSKKYNRYAELRVMREMYIQEIKGLKIKMKGYRYQLKKRRKEKKQNKERELNIVWMNKSVEGQVSRENADLKERIKEVSQNIKEGKIKRANYRNQKERLLQDIYALQAKTGVVYIMEANIAYKQQQLVSTNTYDSLSPISPIEEEKTTPGNEESSQQSSFQEDEEYSAEFTDDKDSELSENERQKVFSC